MTEYEIADLAVSTQAIFWQQWELAQGSFTNINIVFDRFGTVLFGYLIVAYFIGAKLTRVQAGIMTALYLFWLGRLGIALKLVMTGASSIRNEMGKLPSDLEQAIPSFFWLYALCSVLILGSLYFMWTVRHPKTE